MFYKINGVIYVRVGTHQDGRYRIKSVADDLDMTHARNVLHMYEVSEVNALRALRNEGERDAFIRYSAIMQDQDDMVVERVDFDA